MSFYVEWSGYGSGGGGVSGVTEINGLAGAVTLVGGAGITVTPASPTAQDISIAISALTASRAVVTNGSGALAAATTTATEIGYVNGVTSAIQTQLNAKLNNVLTTTGDIIYSSSGTTASRLAVGSTGQILTVVGGVPAWANSPSPTIQRFTSGSGTYTTPANVRYIKVRMAGGGGGGGGGGTSGAGAGVAGGDTTFGTSLLTAAGGAAGKVNNDTGGAGGAATVNSPATTIIALSGGAGASGASNNSTAPALNGGAGGQNYFGGGGARPPGATAVNSQAAGIANTGGGGAGGSVNPVSGGNAGSGGGAGAFIEALISGPSSTYSYAVGAGGGAGGSGTNGYAGAAGGSGVIIVEEYY